MTRLLNIFLVLFFATNIAISQPVYASTDEDPDPFEDWTDEQYQQYEDSILAVLYPPVIEQHTDSLDKNLPVSPDRPTPVSPVPQTITVDKTKEVGQINIMSGTTPTGAKTYEVPLNIYPGVNNFQPNLALTYNSQQGNSIVGNGWALSGLSAITRGGKNIYYDKTTQGILMNNSDSFYLDGVRLIKSGTYADYILYESERGNIKVKGYTSDNTLTYFEVFYPDGSKGFFRSSSSERNDLVYPLVQLTDLHNNTINYTYQYSDNHHRITQIRYGRCTVLFNYSDNRFDPILSYTGGRKIYETQLLSSIVCRLNSQILGTYTLNYTDNNFVSLLSSIGYSSGDKSYNPLNFYYGNGSVSFTYTPHYTRISDYHKSETTEPHSIKLVKGRFDYDSGADGIISLPNKNPYWKYERSGKERFDNKYTGDEKIFIYTGLAKDYETPSPTITTEKGFIDILCADLKGDQNEDIIKINNTVVKNDKSHTVVQHLDRITFKVYRKSASGGITNSYTRTYDFSTVYTDYKDNRSVQPKFYYSGDFNGDGKAEILSISVHQPFGDTNMSSTCCVYDLEENKLLYSGHIFPFKYDLIGIKQQDVQEATNNSDKFFVFDYDGDGKTDLCLIDEYGIRIFTFNVNLGILLPQSVATSKLLTKADLANREILLGEFNGDGLVDLLVSPSNETDSRQWAIYNSKGDSQFEKNIVECTNNSKDIYSGFVIQDVNGDGLTDLIQYNDYDFITYIACNNGFDYGFRSFHDLRYSVPIPVNVNSRNNFNQLLCLKDDLITRFVYNNNTARAGLMTGMANSFGALEKNTYRFTNSEKNQSGSYSRDESATFPYVNISEPVSVIAQSEVFVDGQSVDKNEYAYKNAIVHRQGKGFCGFTSIITTNKLGQQHVKNFNPYNFGLLVSENSPTSDNEYTYDVDIQTNKIARINLTQKSEHDLLTGTFATTAYQYDNYGYPVREQISYSDGLSITRTNTYSSSTELQTGYNLGFLTDQSATITRNGDTYIERVYVQEHNKRLPLKTLYYKNGNQIKQQSHTYDLHGNTLTETTQLYTSANTETTTYSYDIYGRVTTSVDPLGCSNAFSYTRTGLLSTATDARGNIITYEYDSFGRETTVTNPDGTVKTTQYAWTDDSAPGLYSITTSTTGEPTVCTFYDALNREVRSNEVRFDNSIINVDRQYDAYNNLSKVSLPFSGNSASAWDEYEYDQYSRITSLKKASGRVISYAYQNNGLAVTVTDNDVATTKDYDSEGNLVSVTDPNGTISYSLAADGQTASIEVQDGILTTFSYDNYRRQISTTDPSKGTTTYAYDAAGNIATETNAVGQTISNEYDAHNRLIKKTTPEITTAYTYNEYNDVSAVSSDNDTGKTFTYDDLGRIKSVKESGVDGKWLQKDYSYADGNISVIKYTTHLGVLASENYYYTNGHLTEVKLDNRTSVFKLVKENAFGQPTEITSGSLTRNYTFTPYGLPTGRKAATATTTYQDFTYTFDPHKSNLLSRKDNTRNITENFDYDEFNRLTGFGGETVTYDERGNITAKSDVGIFEYAHPTKPYAVTDVQSVDNTIPSTTQNITYTSFQRPGQITEGDITAQFVYNAAYDRVKMRVTNGDKDILTRYYLGNCYELEVSENTHKETLYLCGDYYSAPAAIVKYSLFAVTEPLNPETTANLNDIGIVAPSPDPGEMANRELYFIVRDYLGSIAHIISATNGRVEQELSYDAWGRLRNPATQQLYSPGAEPTLLLGRGYTGHEHLPWFGLINMNARLYDPVLGRCLSPDPFVQSSDLLQNYNRYSYALNNPLCYIDEDGQFFWVAVGLGAAIGGIVNFATHWDEIASAGGWNSVWKGLGYFGVGAVAGGTGAAVSIGAAVGVGGMMGLSSVVATSGFVSGVSSGAAGGAVSGFLTEFSNSLIEGEGFETSLKNGLSGSVSGAVFGGLFNGTANGINAVRNGRDFWSGKLKKITILKRIGEAAEESIGGTGHVAGTKKHKYAEDLIERYQTLVEDTGLECSVTLKNEQGRIVYKLDVYDPESGVIYDYKFGYKYLTEEQLNQTQQMINYREAFKTDRSVIIKIEPKNK